MPGHGDRGKQPPPMPPRCVRAGNSGYTIDPLSGILQFL